MGHYEWLWLVYLGLTFVGEQMEREFVVQIGCDRDLSCTWSVFLSNVLGKLHGDQVLRAQKVSAFGFFLRKFNCIARV